MKFKEQALDELKNKFEVDELEIINILLSGKMKCNTIKKIHVETFKKVIEVLSNELSWSEDEEILDEQTKSETQISSNDVKENQHNKKTCKFVQLGTCKYGRSGKKPDESGKICSFSHPPTCKKHEMFGKCLNQRCKNLHFKLCRNYMNSLFFNYENCKYLHPKRLNNNTQSTMSSESAQVYREQIPATTQNVRNNLTPRMHLVNQHNYSSQRNMEENAQVYREQIPTSTQNVREDFPPRMHLLNQHNYSSQKDMEENVSYANIARRKLQTQVYVQQPFLENTPLIQQPVIDPQKQILDLLTSQNQRLINLEMQKV